MQTLVSIWMCSTTDEDVIRGTIDESLINVFFFFFLKNVRNKRDVITYVVTRLKCLNFYLLIFWTVKTNVTISVAVLAIICV